MTGWLFYSVLFVATMAGNLGVAALVLYLDGRRMS